VSLLVEESRIFQVSTFGTLHLHQTKLDQDQVLLDVMTIADELVGNSRKPGIALRRQSRRSLAGCPTLNRPLIENVLDCSHAKLRVSLSGGGEVNGSSQPTFEVER
jgi:hypothetical protein